MNERRGRMLALTLNSTTLHVFMYDLRINSPAWPDTTLAFFNIIPSFLIFCTAFNFVSIDYYTMNDFYYDVGSLEKKETCAPAAQVLFVPQILFHAVQLWQSEL